MQYRRDIDGLRAVAVLPVILFHAGIAPFAGGYVGVDVFFVISGFLITSLLLEDIQSGRYSIGHFYERRVRRILPALYVVILACIPFAWAWMLPAEMKDFAGSLSIIVFLSNLYFMNEVDYFNTSAELQPLLHTWSLAVEEQYYLLFPPLLWLAFRGGRRAAFATVALLVAGSLLLAQAGAIESPERNFYFSPARFWEIGVGSLCAFYLQGRVRRPHDGATLIGLALIGVSIFSFDSATPFPSLWTLVPVTGAALVVLFGGQGGLSGRLLSARPVVGIGLISYSAYLWHQPLFAFARLRSLTEPSLLLMSFLALMALGLAWLTWRFVEQPFRRRSSPLLARRATLFTSFGALGACILALGFWGHGADGLPQRLPPDALAQASYADDRNRSEDRCKLSLKDALPDLPVMGCGKSGPDGTRVPRVVFIGDSHAMAISGAASAALEQDGIPSYALTLTACPALGGLAQTDRPHPERCLAYQTRIVEFARSQNAEAVVVALRWPGYLNGHRYDNGEGGVETGEPMTADLYERLAENRAADDPARKADVLAAVEAGLRKLAAEFAVVVVDPVPEVGWDVPRVGALCALYGQSTCLNGHPRSGFVERNAQILDLFSRLEAEGVVRRVQTAPLFCPEAARGRCRMFDSEGKPLYFDDDHLAHSTGAAELAPLIVEAVRRSLAD